MQKFLSLHLLIIHKNDFGIHQKREWGKRKTDAIASVLRPFCEIGTPKYGQIHQNVL
jgi:hypothetical protein